MQDARDAQDAEHKQLIEQQRKLEGYKTALQERREKVFANRKSSFGWWRNHKKEGLE